VGYGENDPNYQKRLKGMEKYLNEQAEKLKRERAAQKNSSSGGGC
jgi:hypothetical protein